MGERRSDQREKPAAVFARGGAAGRPLCISPFRRLYSRIVFLDRFAHHSVDRRGFRGPSTPTDRPPPPPSPPSSLSPSSDAKRAGNVIYNVYLFADKFNGTSLRKSPPPALPAVTSALASPPRSLCLFSSRYFDFSLSLFLLFERTAEHLTAMLASTTFIYDPAKGHCEG